MQVQDPSRRPSAVHFLSAFLQGRRHSTSDPVLRLQQARRGSGSATKLLSSSSVQVMVAVSSVSRTEGNPTFPERKSKTLSYNLLPFVSQCKEWEQALVVSVLLECWQVTDSVCAFDSAQAKTKWMCKRRWNDGMMCGGFVVVTSIVLDKIHPLERNELLLLLFFTNIVYRNYCTWKLFNITWRDLNWLTSTILRQNATVCHVTILLGGWKFESYFPCIF